MEFYDKLVAFLGFWAKWFVLKELVAAGYVAVAAGAVIFSIIGAYYYLRVVKLMYFDQPDATPPITASRPMRLILSLNGVAILLLGLLPNTLLNLCLLALAV